ncbi:MAG: HemK family protein methyltransferase [Candidatus Dormibacteraeota bacterium]|nr:HemK family protein methyltransferase [Candidatus Dormibacteraeota bacterium]
MLHDDRAALRSEAAARLGAGGFLAPDEEAAELLAAAGGDGARLEALVARRLTGEPLAWITGSTTFCGLRVLVDPGVYVPRPHTEALALRAAERLPADGAAVDVCSGSGAIAAVLRARRPQARVIAADIDERSVDCARRNGVDAVQGDLLAAVPAALRGVVDVITAVVPYVPAHELRYLQRDTFTFESTLAYDGGRDGARLLRRLVRESTRFVRPGGVLLLELGGDQAQVLAPVLAAAGYGTPRVLADEDGDVRGVEARR